MLVEEVIRDGRSLSLIRAEDLFLDTHGSTAKATLAPGLVTFFHSIIQFKVTIYLTRT